MAKYAGKKSIVDYELKSVKTPSKKVAPDDKLSKH